MLPFDSFSRILMSYSIYTRRGDHGASLLPGKGRLSKCNPIFQALGDLDELNTHLGCIEQWSARESTQWVIMRISAYIATEKVDHLQDLDIETRKLEHEIDMWEEEVDIPKRFILPQSQTHVARAVCRRAERSIISCGIVETSVLAYMNRLSDYLFVLASVQHIRKINKTWVGYLMSLLGFKNIMT